MLLGRRLHPEVTAHIPSLADYMELIYRDDWTAIDNLMLASTGKLSVGLIQIAQAVLARLLQAL